MQIQMWSDIACPFCYIGKRNLEAALALLPAHERDDIEIVYRSFELDPNADSPTGHSIFQELSEKYRMSLAEAKAMTERVAQQAKQVGLTFDFEKQIPTNTLHAHRLIHLAAQFQKMDAMKERLLKAYFCEGEEVSDSQTLQSLAEEVGLPAEKVRELLASDQYTAQVREDEALATELQIRSVPFFVFDNQYALSGAQPTTTFTQLLQEIQSKKGVSTDNNTSAPHCSDEQCDL